MRLFIVWCVTWWLNGLYLVYSRRFLHPSQYGTPLPPFWRDVIGCLVSPAAMPLLIAFRGTQSSRAWGAFMLLLILLIGI